MGRPAAECGMEAQSVPYEVRADEGDGTSALWCPAREECVRPEKVAAEILCELLDIAAMEIGERPTRAVIGVPAYFDDDQRAATEAAGRAAGLETVKLIREPVAAALAYGIDQVI